MDTISDADQLFGQAARARRNQLGITLEQLAQVSSVSTGALSKIERGRLSPSLRNAVAIAHALGCEVNDLLPTQSTAITDSKIICWSPMRPMASCAVPWPDLR